MAGWRPGASFLAVHVFVITVELKLLNCWQLQLHASIRLKNNVFSGSSPKSASNPIASRIKRRKMHILTIYIRLPIDCVSTDGSASTSFVHANVNALMVTPIATRASSGRRVNLRTARQRHVARRPSATRGARWEPRRSKGAAARPTAFFAAAPYFILVTPPPDSHRHRTSRRRQDAHYRIAWAAKCR